MSSASALLSGVTASEGGLRSTGKDSLIFDPGQGDQQQWSQRVGRDDRCIEEKPQHVTFTQNQAHYQRKPVIAGAFLQV